MSERRTREWGRRGQTGAADAVAAVLTFQPEPGELVQQWDDDLIDDSPYQARTRYRETELADLAEGMATTGFAGTLLARPHPDPTQRRAGRVQLVYGHRRRQAWQRLCQQRQQPCRVPLVVREISDGELLIMGAQENLQRADLTPVEEGQLVAWLGREYPKKNQAEIGQLIGKSEDWVRLRSRVHQLPAPLKGYVESQPRTMTAMLELVALYQTDAAAALALAERVVTDQLTLKDVRTAVRQAAAAPESPTPGHAPTGGGDAAFVSSGTRAAPPAASAGERRTDTAGSVARHQDAPAHASVTGHTSPPISALVQKLAEVRGLAITVAQHPVLATDDQVQQLHTALAATLDVLIPLVAQLSSE